MSKSSHTLTVQKGSTSYVCDLYTTTAEAAIYGTSFYLPVNVSGTALYAPLYPLTWSQTFYDQFGTPVHVNRGGTEYVLAKKSLGQINITTKSNETITVSAGGQSWTSGAKYFPYGTTWSASVSASTGWTAGSLSPSSSGTLTNANITVTAGNATHKNYKITLTQKANETLTLHYRNYNGSSYGSWATTTGSVTLGHGSQYYSTISASTGYTAGSITNAGSASSPRTLTGAVTIQFNAATIQKFYLRYGASTEVRYNNASGSKISSGTQINYNQVIWVKNTKYNTTSVSFKLYKNSSASGTVWTTKTSSPFTFNMPNSQIYIYNGSQTGSGDG